jgi:hypothetical protein
MSLATDQADTSMMDVKTNGTAGSPDADEAVKTPQTSGQQLPTPVQEFETPLPSGTPLTNGITLHAPHLQASPAKVPTNTAFNYLNQSVVPMERRFRDPGRGKLVVSSL